MPKTMRDGNRDAADDVVRVPIEQVKDDVLVRPRLPPGDTSGAWSEDPGPVAKPDTHDITMVEERDGAVVLHVEIPPGDPDEVEVDITGDEISVIVPQGTSRDIYCTLDVPPNVDVTNAQVVKVRGHVEIVLPRLGPEP